MPPSGAAGLDGRHGYYVIGERNRVRLAQRGGSVCGGKPREQHAISAPDHSISVYEVACRWELGESNLSGLFKRRLTVSSRLEKTVMLRQ